MHKRQGQTCQSIMLHAPQDLQSKTELQRACGAELGLAGILHSLHHEITNLSRRRRHVDTRRLERLDLALGCSLSPRHNSAGVAHSASGRRCDAWCLWVHHVRVVSVDNATALNDDIPNDYIPM